MGRTEEKKGEKYCKKLANIKHRFRKLNTTLVKDEYSHNCEI